MTVVEPPDTTDARDPGESSPGRAGRRHLVVAVSAVAVGVGALAWWVTHPTDLEPVGSSVTESVEVGDSAIITMFAHPVSGEVRLVSAEPIIAENSAEATVRVLLCGNPTDLPVNTTIGTDRGRAEEVCSSTRSPQGAMLQRVSSRAPYLVIEVTPSAPGTVTISGLRVEYRTGLQRGQQDSGLDVTMRAPTSG